MPAEVPDSAPGSRSSGPSRSSPPTVPHRPLIRRTHPIRTWLFSTALLAAIVTLFAGGQALMMSEFLRSLDVAAPISPSLEAGWTKASPWLVVCPLIAIMGLRFSFGRHSWAYLAVIHGIAGILVSVIVQSLGQSRTALIFSRVEQLESRDGVKVRFGWMDREGELRMPRVVGPHRSDGLPLRHFTSEIRTAAGMRIAPHHPWWWSLVADVLKYLGLAAVIGALTFRRLVHEREQHAARVESELVRSELRAFRAQLQPHFLFNALNGVTVLMGRDVDRARAMTLELSDLLRATLLDLDKTRVPLRREIEVLSSYAELERMRFGDRIEIVLDLPDDLGDVLVPPFCLQPLVENAIRHGPGSIAGGGSIRVTARQVRNRLELTVADDGPGPVGGIDGITVGFGLKNTEIRLHKLYGDGAGLELIAPREGGFVAKISIDLDASPLAPDTTTDMTTDPTTDPTT